MTDTPKKSKTKYGLNDAEVELSRAEHGGKGVHCDGLSWLLSQNNAAGWDCQTSGFYDALAFPPVSVFFYIIHER